MESAENSVQAEKKESTKDEPEKVEAEKPPVEKAEKTEKIEKTEQSEKTEKPETPKEEEKKEVAEKSEEPAKVVEEVKEKVKEEVKEKVKEEEKKEEKVEEKVEVKTEEPAKVTDDSEKCVEKTETTEEVVVEKVVEKVVQQEEKVEEKVEQEETHKSESEKSEPVEEKTEQVEEKIEEKPVVIEDGSAEGPKQIDLQKIFTPATDAEEIIPKNRKLYASSAFYSPGLHPTVEDQVELARKISHSLSDSNNQQSKGQSMYVNRKKRSVKWVHEGEGTATIAHEYDEESKENQFENRVSSRSIEKVPLKLVMDPRGQVKSSTLNDYKFDAGMQSPEICADIVKSLHAPKGKGAELFAKRRKKSENWIVDQTNTTNSSSQGMHDQLYGQAPSIPSTGPKDYSSPTYEQYQYSQSPYAAPQKSPVPVKSEPYEKVTKQTKTETIYSTTRDLAYKPSIPRGWNAPEPSLSKGLYTPPVISLDSYAPPPEVSIPSPTQPSWAANATVQTSHSPFYPSPSSYSTEPSVQTQAPAPAPAPAPTKQPDYYTPQPQKTVYSPTMPQGYKRPTPSSGSFSPPQSNVQHATPSLVFNPSPLPYEKLEKFNRPSSPPSYTPYAYKSAAKASLSPAYPKQKPVAAAAAAANIYKPQPKYEPYQNETQPMATRQTPSNGYATTPTTFPCKSPVYQTFPNEVPSLCTKFSSVDVMHGPTFNTAPRGWNQMRDYYRPVTLDDPKSYAHMAFTDF